MDPAVAGSQGATPVELAIFDIDGPVTAPESRKIEQPQLIDLTLDFIIQRGCVAYNTGRAAVTAYERVVSPLLRRARTRGLELAQVSRRIAILAEKGGVRGLWDDELGQWNYQVDPAAAVPEGIRAAIAELLGSDPEYLKYIFLDSHKQTMVSVEMRHETAGTGTRIVTVSDFTPVAARFAAQARQLVTEHGHVDIEVDHTTIAVDIQRRGVGKDLGARYAFEWLSGMNMRVSRVHCFGDSMSDVPMAAEAYSVMSRSYPDPGDRVTYVHVGGSAGPDAKYRVSAFPGMYGRGTVAYLRCLA